MPEPGGRLLRNHNFSRHPVGSIAKIPFCAAIYQASPFLMNLVIKGFAKGEADEILGIPLRKTLEVHGLWGTYAAGVQNHVDMYDFIEHSSNKYAIILLTLACALEKQEDGSYTLNEPRKSAKNLPKNEQFYIMSKGGLGKPYTKRPELNIGNPEDSNWVISPLENQPFAMELDPLFDVKPSFVNVGAWPPAEGDDLINTYVWKPVMDYIFEDEPPPEDHPFFGISPERENLALNFVPDYRGGFISLPLGGGNSVWTNLKICEVFSRLVTGTKVAYRLVCGIDCQPDLKNPDANPCDTLYNNGLARPQDTPLPMNASVRQNLCDAMTLVAGPQGTAHDLNHTVRSLQGEVAGENKVIGFFSKTGSPRNVMFVDTNTAKAMNALIGAGAIEYLRSEGKVAYRGTAIVDIERHDAASYDGENPIDTALRKLRNNADDMRILNKYHVGSRNIIQICANFNATSRHETSRIFDIEGGRLVRFNRVREISETGGCYAFTMALYDREAYLKTPGPAKSTKYLNQVDVTREPERALTVCINIEGQGNAIRSAVPFAKDLIKSELKEALVYGW